MSIPWTRGDLIPLNGKEGSFGSRVTLRLEGMIFALRGMVVITIQKGCFDTIIHDWSNQPPLTNPFTKKYGPIKGLLTIGSLNKAFLYPLFMTGTLGGLVD